MIFFYHDKLNEDNEFIEECEGHENFDKRTLNKKKTAIFDPALLGHNN